MSTRWEITADFYAILKIVSRSIIMATPEMCGWLTKEGHIIKNWKRRWFVLAGGHMIYSVAPGAKAKGLINLSEVTELAKAPEAKMQPAFKLVFQKDGKNVIYLIAADSPQSFNDWYKALERYVPTSSE